MELLSEIKFQRFYQFRNGFIDFMLVPIVPKSLKRDRKKRRRYFFGSYATVS